jgi:2-polyprenyl-6-methoxyphenol hydroxylase-like FAD-dependent oxidoreductase
VPVTGDAADVAIVGYGPVGTVLAILLAQLGRRVVVLERWPQPYPLPRAVHFDDEVGRILQSCGIGDALGEISEPAEVYEWRNADGATLLRFGRVGPGASGWPQSSMFNQPALEAMLDRRARSLPNIEVRRGVEVVGLEQDGECVTLHAGGEHAPVRARYAIGCDGANSTVREILDVPVHDLGFFYDWLILDVVLDEPRVFDPINLQICDPVRPATAVSGGPGRRRWEFMRLPHEPPAEMNDEATAWRLLEPWAVTPANATLERHAMYTFQARWVEQWRAGRVLLAGDAAHQMPPFAGQGMCSGLRDAANLAWKLDLALDGRAPDSLLDSYQSERMENVRAVIAFSMELGKVICVADAGAAAERDRAMTAGFEPGLLTATPPLPGISGGIGHPASATAGKAFIQGTVIHDGKRRRFDDVVGAGWRLVTASGVGVDLDDDLASWFAALGGRTVGVGSGGELGDPDGAYASWFAGHGAVAVLQRPDFHVYGTAHDSKSVAALVGALRSALC